MRTGANKQTTGATKKTTAGTKRQRLSLAEQEARRQEKQPASSSAPQDEPAALVWPHPEGTRFPLPDSLTNAPPLTVSKRPACKGRPLTSHWDDFDSLHYNGLLGVKFEPTRLISREFATKVEWLDKFERLSRQLGLGTMLFKFYPLYPDLARQFIASCRVFYGNPEDPRPDKGSLYFKVDGKRYSVSFKEINELFGFDRNGVHQHIPEDDATCQGLWREITGKDKYVPSDARHTEVRHPVLRVFLKLFSTTLLCKNDPGKMRKSELMLLHFAIGYGFEYSTSLDMRHKIDFGSVFAHCLEELKRKGLSGSEKVEFVGSLLTPLMQFCQIDFSGRGVNDRPSWIDENVLKKGDIIKGDWKQFYYGFLDDSDRLKLIKIPSHLCAIDSSEALRFRPLPGDFTRLASFNQRRTRPPAPVSAAGSSSHTTASPSSHYTLPPFEEPPVGSYETDPFRSWLVRTLRASWGHCCCSRSTDVIPPSHQPGTTHHTTQEDDQTDDLDGDSS